MNEYYFVFAMDGGVSRESNKILADSRFHRERFKFGISHDDLLDQTLTVQLVGSTKIGLCLSYVKFFAYLDLKLYDRSLEFIEKMEIFAMKTIIVTIRW